MFQDFIIQAAHEVANNSAADQLKTILEHEIDLMREVMDFF